MTPSLTVTDPLADQPVTLVVTKMPAAEADTPPTARCCLARVLTAAGVNAGKACPASLL